MARITATSEVYAILTSAADEALATCMKYMLANATAMMNAAQAALRPLRSAQWNSAAGANTSSGEISISAVPTPYAATLRATDPDGRTGSDTGSLCGRDDSIIREISPWR